MKLVGYYIFYGFAWLLSLLPMKILYFISDIFYVLVYNIFGYRKKIVISNITNSFPEKSKEEINRIAKQFYHHLIDIFIELIAMLHMSEKSIRKRMKYKNLDLFYELQQEGKGIAGVTGHYNNWEWLNSFQLFSSKEKANYQGLAIYKPLSDKNFEKFLNRIREKFGAKAIPMNNTFKELLRQKRKSELPFPILISDQSPIKEEINFWTNFLNQETAVYLGAEKLAQKLDMAVVFLKIRKIKRGYYETSFELITKNAKETTEGEITKKHVKLLEDLIKENPQYWMWSHKRWKHKREDCK